MIPAKRTCWLFAGCLLAGCGVVPHQHVDTTRFYALAVPPVAAQAPARGAARVLVRRVELPGYLHPKAVVVRNGQNQIEDLGEAWWSEPLDLGMARVLREELARRGIYAGARNDQEYDYELVVRVSHAEGETAGGKGSLLFSASLELLQTGAKSGVVARRNFAPEASAWDGHDAGKLALAISKAVADLGGVAAEMIPGKQ